MFPLARLCASSLLVLALATFATRAMAEVSYPLGSRIGLEPPGDLKLSRHFPGFEDIDRKVTITIFDLPASAFPELERAAESKIHLSLSPVKREDFSFRSGVGKLISAHAQGGDFKLNRWIIVAGAPADKDLAMLVGVDVPDAALAIYSDAVIRKTLSTITFRPPPIQEQLGLLPFTVGQLAGFHVTKVIPDGVIMTDGPTDDISKQPYMVISAGQGSPDTPDDRAKFARDLLSTAPLRELTPVSAEQMRIGGSPGFEIRAQAKGPDGDPLMLVQWMRYAGSGFLRMVGVVRKDDWDALFPRFRSIRDGLDLR